MEKRVAVVGSSGGGAAGLRVGGPALIDALVHHFAQIKQCSVTITHAVFIESEEGFDFSTEYTPATLYCMVSADSLRTKGTAKTFLTVVDIGPLKTVDRTAQEEDGKLAKAILSGEIDALVSVSSDPEGINRASISAAIAANIPIVGNGGTSLSIIASQGGVIVGGSGGSVASTQTSRAICFSVSLASYWRLVYRDPAASISLSSLSRPLMRLHSILGAAFPLVLTGVLISTFIDVLSSLEVFPAHIVLPTLLQQRLTSSLPAVVLSIVACSETSHLQELSYITGAAAGALNDNSPIAALLAGYVAGQLLPLFLVSCARNSLLPTASTIISTGGAALLGGLAAFYFRLWWSNASSELISTATALFHANIPSHSDPFKDDALKVTLGALSGMVVSWGSEAGYYHTLMLPLIVAELLATSRVGMLGCLDALCLCVPCAGVCSAVLLYHSFTSTAKAAKTVSEGDKPLLQREKTQRAAGHLRLGWRGAWSNMLMGDFVEACYPYSLHSPVILTSIRIACALAGGIVFLRDLKSSAYIPLPLTILLTATNGTDELKLDLDQAKWALLAVVVSFCLPFFATLLVHIFQKNSNFNLGEPHKLNHFEYAKAFIVALFLLHVFLRNN